MSHLFTTRAPMSEARRRAIHGPLLSRERRATRRLERGFLVLVAALFAFGLWGWVAAFL